MKQLTLLLVLTLLLSCKDSKKEAYSKNKEFSSSTKQEHPGKKLLEQHCYVCHSPTANEDSRIAPPMIAIKKHYIGANTTKKAFVKSMQEWAENPSKETAKMYGAVKRFGLMPKLNYSKESIEQISAYMFDHEIEKPVWFEKHFEEENKNNMGDKVCKVANDSKELSFEEKGMKYAMATKTVLGKNLMTKIQNSGTLEALRFCNIKAQPLTDSLAISHKALIKRVSDKPRNPLNKASSEEMIAIASFKKDILLKKESKPILIESSGKVKFYYPIKTNNKCLQCHGNPNTNIKGNVLAQIQKLYPNDMAKGYGENEIRGIWSITIDK